MLGYRATCHTSVLGLPLASVPAPGHKGLPSQGRVSCGLPERSCFPLGALVLRNSCLLLSSLTSFALSSPLLDIIKG